MATGGVRRILVAVLAVALAGGALIVAARAFGWQAGPLYFLVALTLYAGIGLLLVAVAAALLRAWWLVLPALVLALIVAWWWRPVSAPERPADTAPLAVMSTNLQFGRADPAAVVAAARQHDVALLSVQELTDEALERLERAELDDMFPYRYVRTSGTGPQPAGTGIWSRYPLSDRGRTRGLIFHNLAATVTPPGAAPFTFFAMHPPPPTLADGNAREATFAGALEFMASRPGPAVAAGDFNATRDNLPIRDLVAAGWTDATGTWPWAIRTWPNDVHPIPPLVALDHVLTRDWPAGSQVTVIDIPDTDHRTVVAVL